MKKSRSRNKAQTTRVHNPSGGLAFPLDKERKINMATKKATGRKPNRRSKRAGRRRRKNTTSASVSTPRTTAYKRTANRGRRHHHTTRRRRRNTGNVGIMRRLKNAGESISASSLIIGGVGVLGFDILAGKFLGPQSAPIGAAIKVGGGLLMMNSGKKLPLVGRYAGVIGFGLAFIGTVDLLRIFVLPRVIGFLPAALLPAPAAAASNGMGGLVNYNRVPGGGFGGLVNVPQGSAAAAVRPFV